MIRLKSILNEASKKDVEDYAEDFQKYMEEKYDGKNIAGWKLDVQPISGGFHFSKKGSDLAVLATPFWEGKEIIQIDTVDDEGDYNRLKTIPLRCSFYMDTDERAYIAAMKKFLTNFSGMKEGTLREVEMDIKPGFKFVQTYKGYTVSGRGIVSTGWEVVKDLGNDTFLCRQTHNDTVMKVNPDYTVKFTRKQIEAIKRS